MKRLLFSIAALVAFGALAQTPTVNQQPGATWNRTGNTASPNNGNVIGTFFSSPFYLYTVSLLRIRVNDNMTSSVNTLPAIARNGYVGIGHNANTPPFWSNVPPNPGPFSLLHLNGEGTFVQHFGYRNWMRTGISFTSNNDFAYIGHKQNTPAGANVLDITDLVIAWGDNATPGGPGPDVMKFVFTSGNGAANVDLTGDHPDGREIMRLTGGGNVGIGPRFNNSANGLPQSMLHLNAPNADDATLQLTSQNSGQLATNGFLLRLLGNNRDVWLSQQQDANMLFLTGTNFGSGGERMRISSVGLNQNPFSLPNNLTRVAISHQPGSVTNPRSLLHLGHTRPERSSTAGVHGWTSARSPARPRIISTSA